MTWKTAKTTKAGPKLNIDLIILLNAPIAVRMKLKGYPTAVSNVNDAELFLANCQLNP
jgi:hypothetical protein